MVGATVVSVSSKSGRQWKVAGASPDRDVYLLVPLGFDVRPAQDAHGRMQGGVRAITVAAERLIDERRWRRVA